METIARSPWFLPVVAVCVIAEWWWRSRIAKRGYDGDGARASLLVWLGNIVSVTASGIVLGGGGSAA